MNGQLQLPGGGGHRVLPRPPIVSQLLYMLPDGTVDPQRANDCGEAGVSSMLQGLRGFALSPGCLRQALGGAARTGLTTPWDIGALCRGLGLVAEVDAPDSLAAWDAAHALRRTGHYMLVLGYWLSWSELHWYLAYEGDGELVWVMDPYTAAYVGVNRPTWDARYAGAVVRVTG